MGETYKPVKEPERMCIELKRQKAKVQAKMFQFMKNKKKGRRK